MPPDRCWDVLERVIFVESQLFAAAAGVPSIDNHSILPRSWVLFVAGGAEYGRHATCSLRFCWRPGNSQARSAQRPALLGRLARLVVLARSLMLSIPGWLDWRFFLSRMRFRQLFCGVSTSPYVAFMLGKPLRTLLALPKNMEPMTMTTTEKNQGELAIYLAAGVGHRMGGRLKDHWAAQSSEARPCGGWCGSLCSCLAAWAFSILRRILRCWYLLIFVRPPWNHEKMANEHYLRVTPSESQDWSCWSIRGWHWVCVVWLSVFYQGEELRGNQTKYPQRIPEVRLGPLVSASYELAYKPH